MAEESAQDDRALAAALNLFQLDGILCVLGARPRLARRFID
jgi:hypothetical protein